LAMGAEPTLYQTIETPFGTDLRRETSPPNLIFSDLESRFTAKAAFAISVSDNGGEIRFDSRKL